MMAHFAKIEDGIVTSVLVVPDEHESNGQAYLNGLGLDGTWLQTSYNTFGNVHYGEDGQPDGGLVLRYNYAGIGYTYDETRDAFISPQPFPSWTVDDETCLWQPPVPYPDDGGMYAWDEDSQSWVEASE